MNTSVRFKNIRKKVLAFHSLTMSKPFCLQTTKILQTKISDEKHPLVPHKEDSQVFQLEHTYL